MKFRDPELEEDEISKKAYREKSDDRSIYSMKERNWPKLAQIILKTRQSQTLSKLCKRVEHFYEFHSEEVHQSVISRE